MGNKFGNFASRTEAMQALMDDGFKPNLAGVWVKPGRAGGNLMEAPRRRNAIVEITSYRVDGKWAADGADYAVFQHHYI